MGTGVGAAFRCTFQASIVSIAELISSLWIVLKHWLPRTSGS